MLFNAMLLKDPTANRNSNELKLTTKHVCAHFLHIFYAKIEWYWSTNQSIS